MKTIRGGYADRVSLGADSVVATHVATGWRYYPAFQKEVFVTISDVTVGEYEVQTASREKSTVILKLDSDYVACVRCGLKVDPTAQREFGACRWHTLAPMRMSLEEFDSDKSMQNSAISLYELLTKLYNHIEKLGDELNYYYGSLVWMHTNLADTVAKLKIDTRLMVRVARVRYEEVDDVLKGNNYRGYEQTANYLSTGKYSHDKWTCCQRTGKDAVGCWIGDHSFGNVHPSLHDASLFTRGSEHMTLSYLRELHLSIEAAPSLHDKVLLESHYNAVFGAMYLAEEMMWVVSPTHVGVPFDEAKIPENLEYPDIERLYRAVNTKRELYRVERMLVLPLPDAPPVDISRDVVTILETTERVHFPKPWVDYSPNSIRTENADTLETFLKKPLVTQRAQRANLLFSYTPCLLNTSFSVFTVEFFTDLMRVCSFHLPVPRAITAERHDLFRAKTISHLITQELSEISRVVQVNFNEVLSVNAVYKLAVYRANLRRISKAVFAHIQRVFGSQTSTLYWELTNLLHTTLYSAEPRPADTLIEQLILNRIHLMQTGKLLANYTHSPAQVSNILTARTVVTQYARMFAEGYFYSIESGMSPEVVNFMLQQLIFIEMLNVLYVQNAESAFTLHTVEERLLNEDERSRDTAQMSLIDNLMDSAFHGTVQLFVNALPVGTPFVTAPNPYKYYLFDVLKGSSLRLSDFSPSVVALLGHIGDKYGLEAVTLQLATLRVIIDTITRRFGFAFQIKLARLASYIDFFLLAELSLTTASEKEYARTLLKVLSVSPLYDTGSLRALLELMKTVHVFLISAWIKMLFTHRNDKAKSKDMRLITELNKLVGFTVPDEALMNLMQLNDVFQSVHSYIDVLKQCIDYYGLNIDSSLKQYCRFITTTYGLYDTVHFNTCVILLDIEAGATDYEITANADIDAFIMETRAHVEATANLVDRMSLDNAPETFAVQQLMKQNKNNYVNNNLLSMFRYHSFVDDLQAKEERVSTVDRLLRDAVLGDSTDAQEIRLKGITMSGPTLWLLRGSTLKYMDLIKLVMADRPNTLEHVLTSVENGLADTTNNYYLAFLKEVRDRFASYEFSFDETTEFAAIATLRDGLMQVDSYCMYRTTKTEPGTSWFRWLTLRRGPGESALPVYTTTFLQLYGETQDILLYWLLENIKSDPAYRDVPLRHTKTYALHIPVEYYTVSRRVTGRGCQTKHEDIALVRVVDRDHYLTLAIKVKNGFEKDMLLKDQLDAIAFHNAAFNLEPACTLSDDLSLWVTQLEASQARLTRELMDAEPLFMFLYTNPNAQEVKLAFDDLPFTAATYLRDAKPVIKQYFEGPDKGIWKYLQPFINFVGY